MWENFLNLLRTPAAVAFAHVGWSLDRGNEFQRYVTDTDKANDRTCDDAEDVVLEEDGSDEDVDWNA